MKKFIIFFSLSIILIVHSLAQTQDTIKIDINFFPFDFDYQVAAKETYPLDKLIFSPSMQQSLALTSSIYNLSYWVVDKIKLKNKNPLFNALVQLGAYYSAIIGLTYFPFGESWLHEEFHRSVMTHNRVSSFDQVYNFPLFSNLISVNQVADSDLINFKQNNPTDFIRLTEAGIEGEYLLITELQKKNFFYRQHYPYYISQALITLNSFAYVWICHTQQAEDITNQSNTDEKDIWQRDFTGLDFTAWVYDLFRPNEPYQARGIHPWGNGIDRYIKPSDLTMAERKYLKQAGYYQLMNFISPFILGINRIQLGSMNYNFAFRHFLTSFGYDFAIYNFLQTRDFNFIITPHLFTNYYTLFPGLEINFLDINPLKNRLLINSKLFVYSQPKDLNFFTRSSLFGIYLSGALSLHITKGFYINIQGYAKTKGWVPGIVKQNSGSDILIGLRYRR